VNARFVLIFGVSLVLPLSLFQQYDLLDFWYRQARSFAATVNTRFLLFSVRCVTANVVARFLVFASKVFCRHYECQIFANSAARAFHPSPPHAATRESHPSPLQGHSIQGRHEGIPSKSTTRAFHPSLPQGHSIQVCPMPPQGHPIQVRG